MKTKLCLLMLVSIFSMSGISPDDLSSDEIEKLENDVLERKPIDDQRRRRFNTYFANDYKRKGHATFGLWALKLALDQLQTAD